MLLSQCSRMMANRTYPPLATVSFASHLRRGRSCSSSRIVGGNSSHCCSSSSGFLRCSVRHQSASSAGRQRHSSGSNGPVNLYRRLGVPSDASAADIKAAYRQQALQCHPDVVQEGVSAAAAEAKFRAVSEAYTVLSDPVQRQQHDTAIGVAPSRPSSYSSSAHQRGAASGGAPTRQQHRQRGTTTKARAAAATARSPSSSSRSPFRRKDAEEALRRAFDGETLEDVLFKARRHIRRQHQQQQQQAQPSTSTSSTPAASASSDESAALRYQRNLTAALEKAAAQHASRLQKQYGPGILREAKLRMRSAPSASPPSSRLPFYPFPGMRLPDGVTAPRVEPMKIGEEVLMGVHPQADEVGAEGETDGAHRCTYHSPVRFTYERKSKGNAAALPTTSSGSGGLPLKPKPLTGKNELFHIPHNMGQLYSYQRPF